MPALVLVLAKDDAPAAAIDDDGGEPARRQHLAAGFIGGVLMTPAVMAPSQISVRSVVVAVAPKCVVAVAMAADARLGGLRHGQHG